MTTTITNFGTLGTRFLPLCGLCVAMLAPRSGHADPSPSSGSLAPPNAGETTQAIAREAQADPVPRTDAGDTPVEVVCKAAVALALAEPERARGFLNRARLAGWFPEVRFRVYRRFARTEGLTFDDTGAGVVAPVDISAVDDVRYEWRATWDMSRMVFNPDELQAHFEALRMSDVRRDIQFLVIRLYFERRRLLAERSTGGEAMARGATAESRAVDRRNLRVLEIEAQLDAVSDGAFSNGTDTRRSSRGTAPP